MWALNIISNDMQIIAILLFGSLIVGTLIYIPARFLILKFDSRAPGSSTVRGRDLAFTLLVVVALLGLLGLATFGSKVAAALYVLIMAVATVIGRVVIRRSKKSGDT